MKEQTLPCSQQSPLSSGVIPQVWAKSQKETHQEEINLMWPIVFVELDSFCLCWRKEEMSMSGGPGKRQFPGLMRWRSGRMFAKGKRERERAPGFYLCRCRAIPEIQISLQREGVLKLHRNFHFLLSWSCPTQTAGVFAAPLLHSLAAVMQRDCLGVSKPKFWYGIFDTGIIIHLHRAQAKLRSSSNPGQNSCHAGGCWKTGLACVSAAFSNKVWDESVSQASLPHWRLDWKHKTLCADRSCLTSHLNTVVLVICSVIFPAVYV